MTHEQHTSAIKTAHWYAEKLT